MSKSARQHRRPQRRSRGEIDRNYFFGDVLMRTGLAVGFAMALVAALTPYSFSDALRQGLYAYLGLMTTFGVIGLLLYFAGRHLRHEATHWDFD
jgi:hypothetical protein